MFFIHTQMVREQMVFAPKSYGSISLEFPSKLCVIFFAVVYNSCGRNFLVYWSKKCPENVIF